VMNFRQFEKNRKVIIDLVRNLGVNFFAESNGLAIARYQV